MKYPINIILFLAKMIALGICGVVSLLIFIPLFPSILSSMHPFQYGHWMYLYYSPINQIISFVLCIFFGAPTVIIIDQWFSQLPTRYIIGGAISATIAWTFMDGGILFTDYTSPPWNPNWNLGLFFMAYGITTGALYTVFLWAIDKIKND